MTEQEKMDQFYQDLDNLLKGNPALQGTTDPERYQAARKLTAADFSAHSRARETTRARLLARATRELPTQNKRKEMNTRFSGYFRTLAFGAMLLIIIFGLGWVLSNTTPQLGVGLEPTPTAEPVIVPEEPAIAFPRQPADWGSMAALMNGRLVLVDGCLRMEDAFSDTSALVIWPHDYDWKMTDGIVEVLDGTGQVVARVGEEIWLGGGEADSLAGLGGGDSMLAQIPEACPGPYWLSSGIAQPITAEPTLFRSEANHLEVTLPDGWVAYEGEEQLAAPYTGVVAFNSWGEQGFWAPQVITQQSDGSTTYSYGDEDVLAQIPQDGAYIVLVWESSQPVPDPNSPDGPYIWGPITDPETYAPYYADSDLSSIWQPFDCKQNGKYSLDFSKYNRVLHIEVYCGAQTSDITVGAVNSLLSSWQFDDLESLISNPQSPLTLASDSETIRQRILLSYTFWQALWADAQITDYISGTPAVQRVQVWVNQPAQARVLSGKADGAPATLWISDGQMTRTGEDLSGYGLENFVPPLTESDAVHPHPMTGVMPTPLSSLLFPSGLAQRRGTYSPIAIETVAGRDTLVVEWNRPDGPLVDRFWVDTETGVILRQQNYGKGGDGALTTEYLITSIQYDLTFPTETFNRLATFPPAFATAPDDIYTEVATPVPEGEPDTSLESGEVYLALDSTANVGMEALGRFPANCLISGEPCPQLEFLADVPAGLDFPIAWSPSYQQAMFPVNDSGYQLWRYDRDPQNWTLLDLPYIIGAVWSLDGQWIVGQYLTPGDQEANPLLVANANGGDWYQILADHPGYEMPIAWLDDSRIVILNSLDSDTSEEDGTVYDEIQIHNVFSEETKMVTGITWDAYASTLSWSVSPDGSQFVYALGERTTDASTFTQIDLTNDSQTSLDLPISIWAISWSPNGEWLALTDYVGNTCELYLMHPDGSDLHQVFTGEAQGVCYGSWSPDGKYLLVPALAQTPTIPRLYVIDIATDESRLVELPDVGVEFEWPVVSWVP